MAALGLAAIDPVDRSAGARRPRRNSSRVAITPAAITPVVIAAAVGLSLGAAACGKPNADDTRTDHTSHQRRHPAAPPRTEPVAEGNDERLVACIASAAGTTEAKGLLRTLCHQMQRSRIPGASLAIATAEGQTVVLAAGVRCRGRRDRVLPTTAFRIGSITKSLTAATVVEAAQAGALSLDGPVAAALPGLDSAYAAVTWRQLLNHTSGLADTEPSPANAALAGRALTRALTGGAPVSAPGQQYHYANAGYVLVAAALGTVTNTSPVQTLSSFIARGDAKPPPAIVGHQYPAQTAACGHIGEQQWSVNEDIEALAHGARWTFAAGGVVLSAPKLAALGLRLSQILRTEITADTPLNPWRYGLGLQRRVLADGTEHWFHPGQTGDFAAELHVLPQAGISVAVLANSGAHLRATAYAALAYVAPQTPLGNVAGP